MQFGTLDADEGNQKSEQHVGLNYATPVGAISIEPTFIDPSYIVPI